MAFAQTSFSSLIGVTIAHLRKERDLTQEQLAKEVGLAASTWSRIEKGDSALNMTQLKLTALALGIKCSEILQVAENAEIELNAHGIKVFCDSDNSSACYKAYYGDVKGPILPILAGAKLNPFSDSIFKYLIHAETKEAGEKLKPANELYTSDSHDQIG